MGNIKEERPFPEYIEDIPRERQLRNRVIAFTDFLNKPENAEFKALFESTDPGSLGQSLEILEKWFSAEDLWEIAKASNKANRENLVFWF